MRISDWSSDVCSSDLGRFVEQHDVRLHCQRAGDRDALLLAAGQLRRMRVVLVGEPDLGEQGFASHSCIGRGQSADDLCRQRQILERGLEIEEHTSELQSLMRISYAVFCLKKKNITSQSY